MIGTVQEVSEIRLGTALDVAATPVDDWIVVNDPSEFYQGGGTMSVGGEIVDYIGVDILDGFIYLGASLTASHPIDSEVYPLPVAATKMALVKLAGSGEDAILAYVPQSLYDKMFSGIRLANDQEVVDVDVVNGRWTVLDILNRAALIDYKYLSPSTDGAFPATAPTGIVAQAGLNAIFVHWDAVPNPDPVTYDIAVSATSGFTPELNVAYPGTPSLNEIVTRYGSGSPISTSAPTYMRVRAVDADGPGPWSSQFSATALPSPDVAALTAAIAANTANITTLQGKFPITAPDIAAGAVTTNKLDALAVTTAKLAAGAVTTTELAAGAVTAINIAANTITSTELAAGAITATRIAAGAIDGMAISGASLTIGTNIRLNPTEGLYVAQPGGGRIQLPADGTDAIVQARLVATAFTLTNGGQFMGTSLLSGIFRSSKGIPDPTTPPSLANAWPRTVPTLFGVEHGNTVTDNTAGTHWLVSSTQNNIGGGGAPGFCKIHWINKSTLALDGTATLTDTNAWGVIRTSGGYWALKRGAGGTWSRAACTSSGIGNMVAGSFSIMIDIVDYSGPGGQTGRVWGSDGAEFLFAEANGNNDTISVRRWNPATQTEGTATSLTSSGITGGTLNHISLNSYDFDGTRWLVGMGGALGAGQAKVWNTTPARQTSQDFPLDVGYTQVGLMWDGTRFFSVDSQGLSKYSTDTSAATVYAKYSWDDTNATGGAHHTNSSPQASYTRGRRAYVSITGLPAPQTTTGTDDVNMVQLFAGTTSGSTWLQSPQPALGVVSATYDTIVTSGTAAPTTSNVAGAPGTMESETFTAGSIGWQLKGDSAGQFGPLVLSNTGVLTGPGIDYYFAEGGGAAQQSVTTTASPGTDVTNLSITASVPSTSAVYEVHCQLDMAPSTNNITIAELVVNGAVQATQMLCIPSAAGNRYTIHGMWRVTGITAGSRVFKIAVRVASGSVFVGGTHSNLSVRRVA